MRNKRLNLSKLLLTVFLLLSACQNLNISSKNKDSNSTNNEESSAIDPNTGCLKQPGTLIDVKEINLQQNTVTESGQLTAGKYVGYTFEGKKGQKLSYVTPNDLCLWIFQPNNQILKDVELPIDGKYIVQITLPKGSSTFDLEMSLNLPSMASNTKSNQNNQNYNSSNNSPSKNSSIPTNSINQQEAVDLVKRWYNAKPRIYGTEFNTNLVDELATGKLHYDKTKPGGSIDWLQQNSCYYTYDYSNINNVISFNNRGTRPSLRIQVSEKLQLHGPKSSGCGNRPKNYTKAFTYWFEKENGVWKIYHYE